MPENKELIRLLNMPHCPSDCWVLRGQAADALEAANAEVSHLTESNDSMALTIKQQNETIAVLEAEAGRFW